MWEYIRYNLGLFAYKNDYLSIFNYQYLIPIFKEILKIALSMIKSKAILF